MRCDSYFFLIEKVREGRENEVKSDRGTEIEVEKKR
jgi:hypothetical protein